MLLFFALSYVAAKAIHQAPDYMITVSEKAVNLVHLLTNMIVIDTIVWNDQVHLLVNEITHEFEDNFDKRMSQLAEKGHIALVSDGSDTLWPMQPLQIREHFSDRDQKVTIVDIHAKNEHSKRYYGGERSLKSFGQLKCAGPSISNDLITSGSCFRIHDGALSSIINNNEEYHMHIAHYSGRTCTRKHRKGYYWIRKHSIVCYPALHEGDSIWWDWPGHMSP